MLSDMNSRNFVGEKVKMILTIDYEIFFGESSGTVQNCMIKPMAELMKVLEQVQGKMTVFWDILHYWKLLQLENEFPELKKDRILIESQVREIIQRGHDVQLHLHPHWINSDWKGGTWEFDYSRYSLHQLSNEENPEDINTILGCVTIGKTLIETVAQSISPGYKVFAFRAGGWQISPFQILRKALEVNGILIDSSVCPGLLCCSEYINYDFRNCPDKEYYYFKDNINHISDSGFLELPITSYKMTFFRKIYFFLIKKSKSENFGDGKTMGNSNIKKRDLLWARVKVLFIRKKFMLAIEDLTKQKIRYIQKKYHSKEWILAIAHTKSLNHDILGLILSAPFKYYSISQIVEKIRR
jgi:hypothetical protein